MDKIRREYLFKINNVEPKDYMYEMIRYNIAPTLYGEKCSTLLTFSNKNKDQFSYWNKYKNEYLNKLTLKYFELIRDERNFTVLFYDENMLTNCLKHKECTDFLIEYGYPQTVKLSNYLNLLKLRYNKEFPHEIGLFLGFPIWDVMDYIKNSGKNYIFCGYWKVYSNLNFAIDCFERYNNAKIKVLTERNL